MKRRRRKRETKRKKNPKNERIYFFLYKKNSTTSLCFFFFPVSLPRPFQRLGELGRGNRRRRGRGAHHDRRRRRRCCRCRRRPRHCHSVSSASSAARGSESRRSASSRGGATGPCVQRLGDLGVVVGDREVRLGGAACFFSCSVEILLTFEKNSFFLFPSLSLFVLEMNYVPFSMMSARS